MNKETNKGAKMPHRNKLLDLLNKYEVCSAEDEVAKSKIIDFVKNNKNCFSRENLAGHITGSAWLVGPDKTSVLLTHHKKIGRWLQLGGHADGETDILEVAKKEALEESGINSIYTDKKDIFDLDVHLIEQHKEVLPHYHYDIKFLFYARNFEYKISTESNALKWVDILEVKNDLTYCNNLRKMADKYLKMF